MSLCASVGLRNPFAALACVCICPACAGSTVQALLAPPLCVFLPPPTPACRHAERPQCDETAAEGWLISTQGWHTTSAWRCVTACDACARAVCTGPVGTRAYVHGTGAHVHGGLLLLLPASGADRRACGGSLLQEGLVRPAGVVHVWCCAQCTLPHALDCMCACCSSGDAVFWACFGAVLPFATVVTVTLHVSALLHTVGSQPEALGASGAGLKSIHQMRTASGVQTVQRDL